MAWCMDSEYPEAGYHPQASKPRRSDPDQERELVERLRPGLRAILRKRMPDSLLVEDLLQEGLMLIVENWRLGEISDFPQQILFAHATAVHLASNALRSEDRRLRLMSDFTQQPQSLLAPSPETGLLREDVLMVVRAAVRALGTTRDRELLLRYYVHEQSKAEICEALDLEVRHFDRVLHRARGRLRELVSRATVSGETFDALATFISHRDQE